MSASTLVLRPQDMEEVDLGTDFTMEEKDLNPFTARPSYQQIPLEEDMKIPPITSKQAIEKSNNESYIQYIRLVLSKYFCFGF